MAVVGEAKIVVRAITNTFKRDVERAASGLNDAGVRAGRDFGDGLGKGFGSRARNALSPGFLSSIEAARAQFRRLAIASNIVVPAIAALVGIIGNLVSGLVILVAAAGNAAKAIGVGLLGAISAVVQAGVTLGIAFKGFGKAMEAAKGNSNAAAGAARAEEAALRRLRDARLALKRLVEEEAPAELAAARQAASDAADRAAGAVRSAERAQRSYNDAQLEVLDAQQDLNNARDTAREKLQQLRFELEGAALGEKRARLEFEKSRDSLQAVQDLPPDSRARQEAELAFAQAELNLRKAIDNNSDLRKEENAATQAGVEGSEEVVTAKERIADAIQAEKDAAIDAAIAIRDAARAQQEATQAAKDAAAGGRVEQELQRRIAAAREQVRDAEQAASDARKAASSAADQFAFTDAQLKFAQFVKSLAPAFFRLREAAGDNLFPQLETALGNIVTGLFPALENLLAGTSDTIGKIAVGFSEVVTEGENVRRLESVWTTNDELLKNLGIAGGNLYEALLLILEAAEPVITAFGEWAASSSAQFLQNLADDGDGLRESFERNLEIFSDFKEILGNVFGTFGNLGTIINEEGGAADILLGYLKDITGEWESFTGSEEGKNYLRDFFEGSADNFKELSTLVGLIAKGFLELGATEGIGDFLVTLQEVTTLFNELGIELAESGALESFGEALAGFAELLVNLTESGAIKAFFDTFVEIFDFLNLIFGNETVQKILEFVAPFLAIGLAVGGAFRVLKFLGKAFAGFIRILPGGTALLTWGKRVGTVFGKNGIRKGFTIFTRLFKNFFKGLGSRLGGIGRAIGRAFGAIPKLIGRLIGKIPAGFINVLKAIPGKLLGFIKTIGPRILGFLRLIGPYVLRGVAGAIAGIPGAIIAALLTIAYLVYKYWDEIVAWVKSAGDKLAEWGTAIWDWIKDAWSATVEWVTTAFNNFIEDVKALPANLASIGSKMWSWIQDAWNTYWEYQKERFSNFIADIKALPGKLAEAGSKMWNWLKDGFKSALNFLIQKWNDFSLDLRVPDNFFSRALGLAGKGVTFNTPNIPLLADGGIVSPRGGGTLAMIAEAGRPERVEPLDSDGLSKRDKAMIQMLSGGGSGTTINVYPSPGMNETELANKVSRVLAKQVRKGQV